MIAVNGEPSKDAPAEAKKVLRSEGDTRVNMKWYDKDQAWVVSGYKEK